MGAPTYYSKKLHLGRQKVWKSLVAHFARIAGMKVLLKHTQVVEMEPEPEHCLQDANY